VLNERGLLRGVLDSGKVDFFTSGTERNIGAFRELFEKYPV
jgi:hypothetical protein